MTSPNKTYDVFISHSASEAPLAAELANSCRASGLETVTSKQLLAGEGASDALWEALAESRALLAILSPSGATPSMGIEIGAARAWGKPIFAVVTDPSFTPLPASLAGTRVFPPGRIEDVIEEIRVSGRQLSDEDRSLLADVFREIDVSVDQLALDPKHLQEIVKRFNTRSRKNVPGEQLLSELLRMRKQGWLRRNRIPGRSEPRSGTG